MNVMRWNPFAELDDLFERRNGPARSVGAQEWHPAADIRETEKAYVFELDIPAVDPKDVSVSVRANVLSVAGERALASDGEANDGQLHRRERRFGKFTRSFRLPNDADDEAINASARDGVLTIAVDKRQQAQPRSIEVTSG
ncbi:MAG: Hsp20/alpha crystallin family protein [bacterium]|nr:Hsp20/alpha crystallin family protein [bacterium]